MKIEKLNAIVLALSPALGVYSIFSGVGLQDLCWLILLPLILLSFKENITKDISLKFYACILLLTLLNSSYSYTDISLSIHNLFPISICFGVLILVKKRINVNIFGRTLLVVGCLASIICIYQRIQLITTGSYDNIFFIPGLKVSRELESFTLSRPSAFFTEPAHLSIFLLPIFYWMLTSNKIKYAIVMALGIIFSGSTTGFLLVIVLILYRVFLTDKMPWYMYFLVVCGIIVFIGLLITYAYEVIEENLRKLEVSSDSDNIRLLGGFIYIEGMNLKEHLVGIGLNQLEGFTLVNRLPYFGNYSNAFIYSYLSYGILGFIAFIIYLKKMWKDSSKDRGFFIILIGVLASDQVLFNRNLYYLLMFVILSNSLLDYKSTEK